MRDIRKNITTILLAASAGSLHAETADEVFTLGQITVTATRPEDTSFGDDVASAEEMWRFDTNTLDEAVKLIPGVSSNFDSNGRRNEHDILVRGFGRWQVPLSIDGIRVYLPADNRLDFNRFLTSDLAEVEVRKGYVSVLDGPGGLGGAINLVTRKPTKAFEANAQLDAALDGDGSREAWNGHASLGTRVDRFYALASYSYLDRDGFSLSDDFTPTPMEDGGQRDGSDNSDSRLNAKFGFTPNETDEYSLSYTRQEGEKGAPLNVNNNPPNPPNSYWRWPWWDIENAYFLSNTAIGESAYIKVRAFYNEFDNALYAYDDRTYTTQSANGRFRSFYADDGYGGSVEAGFPLLPKSDTRAAVHYRRDNHTEYNFNRPTHATLSSTEPVQETNEETWSLALENTLHISEALDLLAGVSYDRNEILQAQEFSAARGLYENPTGNDSAFNGQASLQWQYGESGQLSGSISSRSRFPTNFERYSTRFGTAVPNPDLKTERATNYEVAWQRGHGDTGRLSAAVFFSDVTDMIQTVIVASQPAQLTQTQNVGDGEYYGVELAADGKLGASWRLGGNYTYLHREIVDPLRPSLQAVGTPTHQGLLFATWSPGETVSVTPSLEFASDRWSDLNDTTFRRTGKYTLVNLQLQYRATEKLSFAAGGRNLFDDNYQLAVGFPEPGRTLYVKMQLGF